LGWLLRRRILAVPSVDSAAADFAAAHIAAGSEPVGMAAATAPLYLIPSRKQFLVKVFPRFAEIRSLLCPRLRANSGSFLAPN